MKILCRLKIEMAETHPRDVMVLLMKEADIRHFMDVRRILDISDCRKDIVVLSLIVFTPGSIEAFSS